MFKVSKAFEFCASHHNTAAEGPCSRNHGHNWEVRLIFAGEKLDYRGWLVGFGEIKDSLKNMINALDHQDLNQLLPFNPSCEKLAEYLWCEAMARMILPTGVSLAEVQVTERAGDWKTYASYTP